MALTGMCGPVRVIVRLVFDMRSPGVDVLCFVCLLPKNNGLKYGSDYEVKRFCIERDAECLAFIDHCFTRAVQVSPLFLAGIFC